MKAKRFGPFCSMLAESRAGNDQGIVVTNCDYAADTFANFLQSFLRTAIPGLEGQFPVALKLPPQNESDLALVLERFGLIRQ